MKAKIPGHLFTVGRITGSWGRRGFVKVLPVTDFPEKIPEKGEIWLWREDADARPVRIREGRFTGKHVLLGIEGVESISEAEALKGFSVMVDEAKLETLPEGSYYHHQIIGIDVRLEDGTPAGKVEEIIPTGANDVYVIRSGSRELLIPAVSEFILRIDAKKKEMIIRVPQGEDRGEKQ